MSDGTETCPVCGFAFKHHWELCVPPRSPSSVEPATAVAVWPWGPDASGIVLVNSVEHYVAVALRSAYDHGVAFGERRESASGYAATIAMRDAAFARLTAERDEARAFGADVREAVDVAVDVLADERTHYVAAYGERADPDHLALLDRTAATLRDYLTRTA